jgi:hypothetical protein
MAQIKSLEQMTAIVDRNKNLSWDGWTVIESSYNPVAWKQKDGAFVKGKWHTQKRFPLNESGWDLPNKYTEKYEQERVEK